MYTDRVLNHNPAPWKNGGGGNGAVVATHPLPSDRNTGADDCEVYGGFFIGESIRECNRQLVVLAPDAPHVCSQPLCPGNINRLRLESAEEMIVMINRLLSAASSKLYTSVEGGKLATEAIEVMSRAINLRHVYREALWMSSDPLDDIDLEDGMLVVAANGGIRRIGKLCRVKEIGQSRSCVEVLFEDQKEGSEPESVPSEQVRVVSLPEK